jgi:hypothetical protein
MAHLSYPSATEVQLRLGAQEDAILAVVRHWRWWTHAEVEGHVPGDPQVAAVILTAERGADQTIRDILRRSFQMVFPAEGGAGTLVATKQDARPRHRRHQGPRFRDGG